MTANQKYGVVRRVGCVGSKTIKFGEWVVIYVICGRSMRQKKRNQLYGLHPTQPNFECWSVRIFRHAPHDCGPEKCAFMTKEQD